MNKSAERKMVMFTPLPLIDVVRKLYGDACKISISEDEIRELLNESGLFVQTIDGHAQIKENGMIKPYREILFPVYYEAGMIDTAMIDLVFHMDSKTLINQMLSQYISKKVTLDIQQKKSAGTIFRNLEAQS